MYLHLLWVVLSNITTNQVLPPNIVINQPLKSGTVLNNVILVQRGKQMQIVPQHDPYLPI